jgi:fluoride exporter
MQRISPLSLGAVALGGAIGAIARWVADSTLPSELITLVVVNTVGSFAIGLIASVNLSSSVREFIQTGVLGSFTSMSAVIVLIHPNLNSTQSLMAIILTFGAAPLAVWLGRRISVRDIS